MFLKTSVAHAGQRRGWFSFALLACVSALSLFLPGCSGNSGGLEMLTVHGKVTFDGEPVGEGRILFRKTEGDGKAFSGPITGGSYSVQAEPGAMKVEITASRIVPGKFDTTNQTQEPIGEMYIPKKYNAETTLTANVAPGSTEHNFDLTSK